jgi:mannan polymerase II complex ANP1 subunit
VFRAGAHFPAFSFEKHAETEGFGKMAKRMRFSVVGLPHYTIWHLYEPSADDLKHMERMEEERIEKEAREKEETERAKRVSESWQDKKGEWEQDKREIQNKALEKSRERRERKERGERKILGGSEQGPHAHAGEEEAEVKKGDGESNAEANGIDAADGA